MRNFFLLLVLVNLGVLAWFSWVVPAPEAALSPSYSATGITLLRELEEDAAILVASRNEPEPPPEPAVPPANCVAIGPFAEAELADAALATVVAAGYPASLRIDQEEIWEGYWVYVGGLPNAERANAALAQLTANGIADAYVIPDSDSGVLISLGVFSDLARAGNQAEIAGRFGLAATISERVRTTETRWLELALSGEESQALDLLQEPGQISRLERRECGPVEAGIGPQDGIGPETPTL